MTCSGAEDIQCYDAFSMIDNGNDDNNDDKEHQLYITILLIVTAISCFLGGASISFCCTHYHIRNKSLKEPLLDTKYDPVPLGNDDRVVSVSLASNP